MIHVVEEVATFFIVRFGDHISFSDAIRSETTPAPESTSSGRKTRQLELDYRVKHKPPRRITGENSPTHQRFAPLPVLPTESPVWKRNVERYAAISVAPPSE